MGSEMCIRDSAKAGTIMKAPLAGGTAQQLAMGQVLERSQPELVTTNMGKEHRPGRVFVDWSQNTFSKTTIAVYSLRARPRPMVSTPLAWDEVQRAVDAGDVARLRFDARQVLDRVKAGGDRFEVVLKAEQRLPTFS